MKDIYEKTIDNIIFNALGSGGGGGSGVGVALTSFPLKAILVISVQYGTGYTSQSKVGGVD